ncbi:MAG: class II aldolase/adducin family protein [Pseudomonadota bacterium]
MTLGSLRAASAELGRAPLLIQGPGGNTSIKLGDVMWIKASGTELQQAESREIFVPVNWVRYRHALLADPDTSLEATAFALSSGLRPSIETPLHAVFADPVVIHVHCVETIAWAVREDAMDRLRERLDGHVPWHFVPYARPGQPLLPGIVDGVARGAKVFVLGNHGLIVVGETVEAAHSLQKKVTKRLVQAPRPSARPDQGSLDLLTQRTPYTVGSTERVGGILAHPDAAEIVCRGPLYPDHVVFLGLGPTWCEGAEAVTKAIEREELAIVVAGQGVLLHDRASSSAQAMLGCLSDVLARLPSGAPLMHLTREQCDELLNWDAETYRQKLGD